MTTLHEPAHREALWELSAALDRDDVVTVFGRCTVEYDGRAESSLGAGDRLLILKPDGSALVHTATKRTPVNWQPPGSEHYAAVRDGRLRVRSERTNPDERLDVRFEAVHQLSAMAVTGGDDLEVAGSEADLKEAILANPSLIEPGFEPKATERESSAGPMDVFGVDSEGRPVVVELKRRRVGPAAAGQLGRYVDALERELGVDGSVGDAADGTGRGDCDESRVRGILVSPSITDRAAELLAERGFEHVALDPTGVDVDVTDTGVDDTGVTDTGLTDG
ncbi:RecB family endonuclease [Halalkaliarchaeum sp. AArc-CO]|nr:RecB family endonuclease [Halalkaliarchaeum sp. AArc-CO]